MKLITLIAALSFMASASASFEGLDPKVMENSLITGFSRPCCTFSLDIVAKTLGLSKIIDKEALGEHHFARLNGKDNVGMNYTCSAGFVDVSHLRDNADWTAHIYFNLKKWLGSGQEVLARREGGFDKRAIYFPKLSPEKIEGLTDDDLEKLAISVGFNMALLHEIATSFKIAVSAPITVVVWERKSAFSVEDAYSNLLGNTLGAKAARHALPYDQAMTKLIHSTLKDLGSQSKATTLEAFDLVRNEWWIQGLSSSFKKVLKRNFLYQNEIVPLRVPNAPFCTSSKAKAVSVPGILSNGHSVNEYFEVRADMKANLKRGLRKMGVNIGEVITQENYPHIIAAIKKNFIQKLGPEMENP